MANPMKGQVSLDVNGTKYTFVLGMYALVWLERRVKMPWPKYLIGATKGEWGYEQILIITQAALMRHHGNMTEQEVMDLIDQISPNKAMNTVQECITLMMPDGDSGAEAAPENPTKPGNGQMIGNASIPIG